MIEMVKAISRLVRSDQDDAEAGFLAFEKKAYDIPGLGQSGKLLLHYYISEGNIPVRAELLITLGENIIGENAVTFTLTGSKRLIASPDIDVDDAYQSYGIGRNLLLATEPVVEHALAHIKELHGKETVITITDEAGARTQERGIRRGQKRIKREGWTSHIVTSYMTGFQEITQAGEPPTFTKRLR